MTHKTRLGPIAIFLVIVTMVITTLAVLTVATSNADITMARRFADVTRIRYGLEAQAEEFLSNVESSGGAGAMDGVTVTDGGYEYTAENEGYRLEVAVTGPDAAGDYGVTRWKLTKIWNASDPMNSIWPGN
ncbi:MAG: hypothetical protein IJH90_01770 [Mogibacterium sp.]|nr:hypothetical protein [Mogibacterium sp.]